MGLFNLDEHSTVAESLRLQPDWAHLRANSLTQPATHRMSRQDSGV